MNRKNYNPFYLPFFLLFLLSIVFTGCSDSDYNDIATDELNVASSTASQRNNDNIKLWLQEHGGSTWRLQTNRNNGSCDDYTYNQLSGLLDSNDNKFAYLIGTGYTRLKLRVEESQNGSCYGSDARTEFRQTNSSNSSSGWSTGSSQQLDVSLKMIKIDNSFNRVCVAQYFGEYSNDNDDIVKIVAIRDGSKFDLRINHSGLTTSSQDMLIANNHDFNSKFRIRLYTRRYNGKDQFRVRYDGPVSGSGLGSNNNKWLTLKSSASTGSAYWKTGLYAYSSTTSGGSAEAEWYDISY